MLTRFQYKANLYATVFENPLVLNEILMHLDAKDSVNMLITNAPFTYTERFVDTINMFLMKKKDEYEQKLKEKRMNAFHKETNNIFEMIYEYQYDNNNYVIEEHFRHVNSLFDHILTNMWIFDDENNQYFRLIIEKKLIEFVIEKPAYKSNALYYLEKICNIHIDAENDENNELIEFIITSEKEKIYVY